jgi:hypothetical protein
LREKGGKFEKGWAGGPGRQKGGHNKTTRVLKDAMLFAAEAVGDLSGIAREPKAFLHILGKLIPAQVKVDTFTQTVYHSVEELQRDVAARGLNLRAFGKLLLEAHQVKKGEFDAGENGGGTGA